MKIKSTDYPLTDSIKSRLGIFQERLEKYFKPTNEVEVTLSKEAPDQFRIDIQSYAFGRTIRSHYLSHDFQKAFKFATDHFIESIVKAKEIIKDKRISDGRLKKDLA